MRSLLLLLIILTILGAAAYFAIALFGEDQDPSDTADNTEQTDQTGDDVVDVTSPTNPAGSDDDDDDDSDGGTATDTPLPSTDPTNNSTGGTGTNGTGNLPSTALINDTIDRVLMGLAVVSLALVLFKTNAVGKIFFPSSEYFNVDFFGVADDDYGKKSKVRRQLDKINQAISVKD